MAAEGLQIRDEITARTRLQWGRGRMAAEGTERARPLSTDCLLQWGRGRMAAEGRRRIGLPDRACAASMGPRPDGRGRAMRSCLSGRIATMASMGPRPDGRGRLPVPSLPLIEIVGFNGAAAGWPRKACGLCRPFRPLFLASMGPRPDGRGRRALFRLGKRRHGASMGPRPDGRGRLRRALPDPVQAPASMGPRPDGRGRQRRAWRCRRPCNGFNGAAAGWPRKANGVA